MFRGVSTLNLDGKGRLAIPTKYRDELALCCASQLVVTADKDRCLLLYPEPEWRKVELKLKNLPTFDKVARKLQRLYIGYASDLEMDGQGRILLPPSLREYAEMNKRVALVGQGNKFEIWNEEAWNAQWEDDAGLIDLDASDLSEDISSISL